MKYILLFSILCFSKSFQTYIYSENEDQEIQIKLELRTMAIAPFNSEMIYINSENREDPIPLSFNAYHRSDPINYIGPPDLVFFRLVQPNDPGLPPVKLPVASFSVNPNNYPERILLFFVKVDNPENNSGRRFRVLGMNDTFEAFPTGKIIIFNPTDFVLQGKVNNEVRDFGFGPSEPFPLNASTHTAFAIETTIGPRMVFEGVFNYTEENRVILMLRPPRRRGSIRFSAHNIFERAPPTTP